MRIEIRADCVRIDGYVNAVERDSKVLQDREGKFIEKIKAGAFKRALDRAGRTGYDVKVLLNHDYGKKLTSTGAGAYIREDNIGLRCTCEIRDETVMKKAREGKLSGWSFGFISLKTKKETRDGVQYREIQDLDLKEVSILDDTRTPAYNGTSIETRSDDLIEVRDTEGVEIVDLTQKKETNYKYHNRIKALRASAQPLF